MYRSFPPARPGQLAATRVRRSVVRVLGAWMPVAEPSRVRVLVPAFYKPEDSEPEGDGEHDGPVRYIPSLADVQQLARCKRNHGILLRVTVPSLREELAATSSAIKAEGSANPTGAAAPAAAAATAAAPTAAGTSSAATSPSSEQLQSLQEELARLKSMIAAVVTRQETMTAVVATPAPAFGAIPPPPPPMFMMGGGSGGPPPPPPPPPPPGSLLPRTESLASIIAQNKKDRPAGAAPGEVTPARPSMAAVLKDLGSVKLRRVDRSPGGRPVHSAARPEPVSMDPAALIAAALKRKFANCNGETKSVDWAEKENNFRSRLDDKSSPVKPDFGPHMLRKTHEAAEVRSPLQARNRAIGQH